VRILCFCIAFLFFVLFSHFVLSLSNFIASISTTAIGSKTNCSKQIYPNIKGTISYVILKRTNKCTSINMFHHMLLFFTNMLWSLPLKSTGCLTKNCFFIWHPADDWKCKVKSKKKPTGCSRVDVYWCSLSQHISGIIMPIVRSTRLNNYRIWCSALFVQPWPWGAEVESVFTL
jgi:hypothetical protein